MRTWKNVMAASLAFGAGSLAACGGGGSGDDAATPDASAIDGRNDAGPSATRAAGIAITDIALTSADGVAGGWKGASVQVHFEDLGSGGGEIVYQSSSCVVVRYDSSHPKRASVDAGVVRVTAPEAPAENALKKPLGDCSYLAGDGYVCSDRDAVGQHVQVIPTGLLGTAVYLLPDQDLTGKDYVGSYLRVSGMVIAANNSAIGFPIQGQSSAGPPNCSLTVYNPAAMSETASATASISILNGRGPIPTVNGGTPSNADFLGDDATSLRIIKDANAQWGAVDVTVPSVGENLTLADSSARPEQFPSSAADVVFSCDDGASGNCGPDPSPLPAGVLPSVVIAGRTTDANVVSAPKDFTMPEPVNAWVEFECAYAGASSATLPQDAVTAILATNPTRVETRFLRVDRLASADAADSLNQMLIEVGHGLVGHTTMP